MLHCFIEGQDDETFFKHIFIDPETIDFYRFSQKTTEQVNKYIKALKRMDEPYIFLADSDGNTPAVKTAKLLAKYSELQASNIYIVQYEIESWFLAGVDKFFCDNYKFKNYYPNTDAVTKEMFLDCIENVKDSRLSIFLNILSIFSCSLAKTRNNSFATFYHSNQNIFK